MVGKLSTRSFDSFKPFKNDLKQKNNLLCTPYKYVVHNLCDFFCSLGNLDMSELIVCGLKIYLTYIYIAQRLSNSQYILYTTKDWLTEPSTLIIWIFGRYFWVPTLMAIFEVLQVIIYYMLYLPLCDSKLQSRYVHFWLFEYYRGILYLCDSTPTEILLVFC